jgi:hypothetical protein
MIKKPYLLSVTKEVTRHKDPRPIRPVRNKILTWKISASRPATRRKAAKARAQPFRIQTPCEGARPRSWVMGATAIRAPEMLQISTKVASGSARSCVAYFEEADLPWHIRLGGYVSSTCSTLLSESRTPFGGHPRSSPGEWSLESRELSPQVSRGFDLRRPRSFPPEGIHWSSCA